MPLRAVVVLALALTLSACSDDDVKDDGGTPRQDHGGTPPGDGSKTKKDTGGTKKDTGGTKKDTGGTPGKFGDIAGYAAANYAEDLVVVGNFAYVTGKEKGLYVFDISSPSSPSLVKTIKTTHAWDLVAASGHLYVADYAGGMRIYDITAGGNPKALGVFKPAWKVIQVAVNAAANRAYASGGDGKYGQFAVVNISDKSTPKEVGSFSVPATKSGAGTALAYKGNHVYYGQADGKLVVLNVANPGDIKSVGSYFNKGTVGHQPWALGLTVHGNRLYMADWGAGVIILDITNPAKPTELSVFAKGGYAFYDVFARDDRAYVALDGGLGVLDVKDPKNPKLVGGKYISCKISLDDGLHGVWLKGNYAYVADNKEKKLTVVNIKE